jgi:hypothetical protein
MADAQIQLNKRLSAQFYSMTLMGNSHQLNKPDSEPVGHLGRLTAVDVASRTDAQIRGSHSSLPNPLSPSAISFTPD